MNRCEAYNDIIPDTVQTRKLEVAVYLNKRLTQVKANKTGDQMQRERRAE